MRIAFWSNIKIRYLDLKIGSKLMLMYLVAFLIPFIFLLVFGYSILQGELTERANHELVNEVFKTSQNIDNKLDSYVSAATMVLLDQRLQLYLQEEHKGQDSYLEAYNYIEDRVNTILALYPGIASVTLYTSNKTLPSDHVLIKHIDTDAMPQSWYTELSKIGESKHLYLPTELKEARSLRSNDKREYYVFTLLLQLPYYISNYNSTIFSMDIRENEISSFLKQQSGEKQLYVIDSAGNIVSSASRSHIGTPIEAVSQLFVHEPKTGNEWVEGYQDGIRVVVCRQPLKNGWSVVGQMTYANLFKKANYKLLQLIIAYMVFLFLAVVFFYFTSRVWTRRIHTLTQMMKQLEVGNFNIPSGYTGKDEFDEMLRSFSNMSRKIDNLIREVYIKETAKKEAELNNLQYLINPHFLYNSLSAISAQAKKNGEPAITSMVSQLARFYRLALSKGRNLVDIEEEISLTENYLAIQAVQYPDRVRVHFDLDKSLFRYKTLKVILQPFIENSISHGFWNQDSILTIIISLYRENECLCFQIIDDGAGFDTNIPDGADIPSKQSGNGYGIANVDERIKLVFGEQYGVTIYSRRGIGTTVTITIPAIDGEILRNEEGNIISNL